MLKIQFFAQFKQSALLILILIKQWLEMYANVLHLWFQSQDKGETLRRQWWAIFTFIETNGKTQNHAETCFIYASKIIAHKIVLKRLCKTKVIWFSLVLIDFITHGDDTNKERRNSLTTESTTEESLPEPFQVQPVHFK